MHCKRILVLALLALPAARADAADITVMCPPPMRAVMTDLVAAFEHNLTQRSTQGLNRSPPSRP